MSLPFTREHPAKVAIVDDHPLVREHLSVLLNQQEDLQVCAACGSREEVGEVLRRYRPHVLIVDLSLGKASGIDVIRDVKKMEPDQLIVVLSMHQEAAYVEQALRAGARGYVTKSDATGTIVTALREVLAGELYLSRPVATQMVSLLLSGEDRKDTPIRKLLTARELEIFELLGQEMDTRDVVNTLGVELKTIQAHYANLRAKLKCDSLAAVRREAVAWRKSSRD